MLEKMGDCLGERQNVAEWRLCTFWSVLVEVIRTVDNASGTRPHFWWGIKKLWPYCQPETCAGVSWDGVHELFFWGIKVVHLATNQILWQKQSFFCLTPWTTGSSTVLGLGCSGRIPQFLWLAKPAGWAGSALLYYGSDKVVEHERSDKVVEHERERSCQQPKANGGPIMILFTSGGFLVTRMCRSKEK